MCLGVEGGSGSRRAGLWQMKGDWFPSFFILGLGFLGLGFRWTRVQRISSQEQARQTKPGIKQVPFRELTWKSIQKGSCLFSGLSRFPDSFERIVHLGSVLACGLLYVSSNLIRKVLH